MDRHSNEMGLVEKYKNSLGKIAKIVNSIAFSPDLPPFLKKSWIHPCTWLINSNIVTRNNIYCVPVLFFFSQSTTLLNFFPSYWQLVHQVTWLQDCWNRLPGFNAGFLVLIRQSHFFQSSVVQNGLHKPT